MSPTCHKKKIQKSKFLATNSNTLQCWIKCSILVLFCFIWQNIFVNMKYFCKHECSISSILALWYQVFIKIAVSATAQHGYLQFLYHVFMQCLHTYGLNARLEFSINLLASVQFWFFCNFQCTLFKILFYLKYQVHLSSLFSDGDDKNAKYVWNYQ